DRSVREANPAHRQRIRYESPVSFSCMQQYTERQQRRGNSSPTKLRWAVQAGSTWIRRIDHTGPERDDSAGSASAEKEGEYGEVRRAERSAPLRDDLQPPGRIDGRTHRTDAVLHRRDQRRPVRLRTRSQSVPKEGAEQ